ncbi:MAG: MFS transporter [Candidatus Marinimicrobia bacterium]|nr:MFS transporter [Candidatus Neomarinimicrobiota bacterium]
MKLRNLTLLLGSIISVISAVGIATAIPDMSVYFRNVPNSEFLVKLVLTIPSLAIALTAFFFGYLLDKWGRKPILILGLIIYVLAGTSGFIIDSLYILLLSRVVLGLAVAGTISGITTLLIDYFHGKELEKYMGYQGAFLAIGGLFTLSISGVLADIGWKYPFLIHLFGLLILPGIIFFISEPKIPATPKLEINSEIGIEVRYKPIFGIYALGFVSMLFIFIFPVQLPFLLKSQLGLSNTQVGLFLAFQTPIAIIISINYSKIKALLSFQLMFALIFLSIGINHLIVAMSTNYSVILFSMLFGGVSLGLFPPTLNVWLASVISPDIRGRAISGLTTFIFLAQFMTPIVTQPLVESIGLVQVFGYTGIVSLILFGVMIVLNRRK